jgi:hypothetical protein
MSLEDERQAVLALSSIPTKQVFVNTLIVPYIRLIDQLMATNTLKAIKWIFLFVSDLEDEDRRMLKAEVQQLDAWYVNARSFNWMDMLRLWQRIKQHVHIYYLREIGIRAKNPYPQHIRQEEPQPENREPEHIGENVT